MENIFLITNTNINTSAGNITLILRRAEALYKIKELFTTIIVYKGLPQKKVHSNDTFYQIEYIDSYRGIFEKINNENPCYIILYGDRVELLTYPLHHYLAKTGSRAKIILDVQGSIEQVKEYPETLLRKILYPVYFWFFVYAIRDVDGAFVVSNELMQNCEEKRSIFKKIKKHISYYKVRCGINIVPSLEEIITFRKQKRITYGLSKDTVVFTYSGYRFSWQKVDDIIEQFQKYDALIADAYFMFFCNTDELFEKQLSIAFPKKNYLVKLLGKDEYGETLCACDVGYLLRDYNETNRVAFPNKFSDYASSGLLCAINGALPEPVRLLKDYEVPFIDTDNLTIEQAIDLIYYRRDNYIEYLKKTINVCENELLYESQILKSCIEI